MVVNIFAGLKALMPGLKRKIHVDDGFDQLNHSFLFLVLVLCGSVVTVTQFTASTIVCHGFTKFSSDFVNAYCWTQGPYTIKEAYTKAHYKAGYVGIIPEDIPACRESLLVNGQRIKCPHHSDIKPFTRVYHLWYQWLPFYYVLAAMLFYMPYLLYKVAGFGRLKPVLAPLQGLTLEGDDSRKVAASTAKWIFLNYFPSKEASAGFSFLARYRLMTVKLLCKVLYLLVSVVVFLLTCFMFRIGEFRSFGYDYVSALRFGDDKDAMMVRDKLFPKMIACEVVRYGASGREEENGLCVLAPNVINQYLFLVLWFSYVIVICTNTLSLVAGSFKICCARAGYTSFVKMSVISPRKRLRAEIRRMYMRRAGPSGRLVLDILAKNVHTRLLEEVLTALVKESDRDTADSDDDELENGTKIPPRYRRSRSDSQATLRKTKLYPSAPSGDDTLDTKQ